MNTKLRKTGILQLSIRLGGVFACLIILITLFTDETIGINKILFYYLLLYTFFCMAGITTNKSFFMSAYFWFFLFFFLYQTIFPFILFYGGITYYSVSLTSVTYTSIYSLKFLCIMFGIFFLFTKKFILNRNMDETLKYFNYNENSNGLILVALITLCLELYCLLFGGLLSFILSDSTNRTEISLYVTSANVWTYIGYLNIYLFVMYILLKKNGIKRNGLLIWLDICFYISINILVGSRKFVLYVMIILLIFYVMNIFHTKLPLLGGAIIVAIATYQRIFIFDGGLYGNVYRRLAGMLGEFIFPTISFPISYQIGLNLRMFNYPTILDSVLYFIPRSLFDKKNYSIGVVFAQRMNVGMGFAANPMLEAYLNFGEWGWIVEAFLITIILRFITYNSEKNFVLFIFGIVFLVDLNRGEISYFVRQMLEISITVYFTNWLARKVHIYI